jgi:H+/gluconate symporter-like permease
LGSFRKRKEKKRKEKLHNFMDSLHDPKKTFVVICTAMLVMVLTSLVFVFGLADQLRFSPDHLCLLYVKDYRQIDSTWQFDADSSTCGWALFVGSFDIFFAIALGTTHYLFWKRGDSIPRRVLKIITLSIAVWAFISMITAATISGGIGKKILTS